MKLENQVCTLEQAKELKELGLELESYFVWHKSYEPRSLEESEGDIVLSTKEAAGFDLDKGLIDYYIPAYSCAELGVLLPDAYYRVEGKYSLIKPQALNYPIYIFQQSKILPNLYRAYYEMADTDIEENIYFDSNHEAHAKADLLIHLLKEKIIKSEDLSL